jgi:nucleotide-binding universal stress UspA family protein
MTPQPPPRIVVGYDGSAASQAALRLAAARAGAGKVFVVHGYDAPADYWGGVHYDALLHAALDRGERILEQATAAVPELAGVEHELELIAGHPAEVIANVAAVRDADEIIVGTRGFGRIRGALGSVAHALLHEARCPVTVIPTAAVPADGEAAERVEEVTT